MSEHWSLICASARLKLLNLEYAKVSSVKKLISLPDDMFSMHRAHRSEHPCIRSKDLKPIETGMTGRGLTCPLVWLQCTVPVRLSWTGEPADPSGCQ